MRPINRSEWKSERFAKDSERWIGRAVSAFLLLVASLMIYGLSRVDDVDSKQIVKEKQSPFYEEVVIENQTSKGGL